MSPFNSLWGKAATASAAPEIMDTSHELTDQPMVETQTTQVEIPSIEEDFMSNTSEDAAVISDATMDIQRESSEETETGRAVFGGDVFEETEAVEPTTRKVQKVPHRSVLKLY